LTHGRRDVGNITLFMIFAVFCDAIITYKCKTYQFKTLCKDDVMISVH